MQGWVMRAISLPNDLFPRIDRGEEFPQGNTVLTCDSESRSRARSEGHP
jgi:hypothetical protein